MPRVSAQSLRSSRYRSSDCASPRAPQRSVFVEPITVERGKKRATGRDTVLRTSAVVGGKKRSSPCSSGVQLFRATTTFSRVKARVKSVGVARVRHGYRFLSGATRYREEPLFFHSAYPANRNDKNVIKESSLVRACFKVARAEVKSTRRARWRCGRRRDTLFPVGNIHKSPFSPPRAFSCPSYIRLE